MCLTHLCFCIFRLFPVTERPSSPEKVMNFTRCFVGLLQIGTGARFSKLPVIIGSVKVFSFPFQMGVSKGLKIVQ